MPDISGQFCGACFITSVYGITLLVVTQIMHTEVCGGQFSYLGYDLGFSPDVSIKIDQSRRSKKFVHNKALANHGC